MTVDSMRILMNLEVICIGGFTILAILIVLMGLRR